MTYFKDYKDMTDEDLLDTFDFASHSLKSAKFRLFIEILICIQFVICAYLSFYNIWLFVFVCLIGLGSFVIVFQDVSAFRFILDDYYGLAEEISRRKL